MSKPRQDHQEEIMENNSKTTFFSNVELEKLRKLLNQWDNVGLNSTQDLATGKMIGHVEMKEGLYCLDTTKRMAL
ncbi:hypothetical protein CK203_053799 [Vitis vinifera]|uniref:Uncharacterized protein n=1 Tax=Vitis vinifera TaxID=29760 RepID=A0A438GQR0_VITVI|nr:hypothetical protein CK203_053799 [Vitis vinifera]